MWILQAVKTIFAPTCSNSCRKQRQKTNNIPREKCRWAILKDAIQKRGHEAVADFVGTDISSDTYDRVMDETEAQMPDEEFERFWEKYI